MKPGSLVRLIDDNFDDWFIYECIELPTRGNIYTVRQTRNCTATGKPGLLLEEIKNGNNKNGLEWGFYAERFQEVLEPLDVNELLQKRIQKIGWI